MINRQVWCICCIFLSSRAVGFKAMCWKRAHWAKPAEWELWIGEDPYQEVSEVRSCLHQGNPFFEQAPVELLQLGSWAPSIHTPPLTLDRIMLLHVPRPEVEGFRGSLDRYTGNEREVDHVMFCFKVGVIYTHIHIRCFHNDQPVLFNYELELWEQRTTLILQRQYWVSYMNKKQLIVFHCKPLSLPRPKANSFDL